MLLIIFLLIIRGCPKLKEGASQLIGIPAGINLYDPNTVPVESHAFLDACIRRDGHRAEDSSPTLGFLGLRSHGVVSPACPGLLAWLILSGFLGNARRDAFEPSA